VQNRLQMFALNAEVVFSEVDNQKKSTEEAQVTLATSEKFIPQDLNLEFCLFQRF
jgi:folate-binding Fe-S cluster repair protein YgfZ